MAWIANLPKRSMNSQQVYKNLLSSSIIRARDNNVLSANGTEGVPRDTINPPTETIKIICITSGRKVADIY